MSKVLCIYHKNCADGLGAAWAVYRALGDEVEFVAAKYGELPPYCSRDTVVYEDGRKDTEFLQCFALAGHDILIVDFSYSLEVLHAMAKEARSVLVLDHHATVQEDLQSLPRPSHKAYGFGTWLAYAQANRFKYDVTSNLVAEFDLNRSGAGLTWDYLNQVPPECSPNCNDPECPYVHQWISKPRPRILDLIEDRDLWRFKFGDESRAFHAVLQSYDWSDLPAMFNRLSAWAQWSSLERGQKYQSRREAEQEWQNILREGHAILRANAQAVASIVAASRRTIKIAGHVVPCANVPPSMASDAGHLLCQKHYSGDVSGTYEACVGVTPAFSATYYDGADGKRHFSLRSPEGGADVGAIAKSMAEKFNTYRNGPRDQREAVDDYCNYWTTGSWAGGGHVQAAGFDAPLGWEGE